MHRIPLAIWARGVAWAYACSAAVVFGALLADLWVSASAADAFGATAYLVFLLPCAAALSAVLLIDGSRKLIALVALAAALFAWACMIASTFAAMQVRVLLGLAI
jgi:hypothetical protein